jgi:hypothetical protein
MFILEHRKKFQLQNKKKTKYVNLANLIIDFSKVQNKFHTPKTLATHYTIHTNPVVTYLKVIQVFLFIKTYL